VNSRQSSGQDVSSLAAVDRYARLTATDLPQRPRVLTRNPDRHLPELRKPRVIDHPRIRRQLPAHLPRQRPAHCRRIPRRLIDELLQTPLIRSSPSANRAAIANNINNNTNHVNNNTNHAG
jgi:hypothetical protein